MDLNIYIKYKYTYALHKGNYTVNWEYHMEKSFVLLANGMTIAKVVYQLPYECSNIACEYNIAKYFLLVYEYNYMQCTKLFPTEHALFTICIQNVHIQMIGHVMQKYLSS